MFLSVCVAVSLGRRLVSWTIIEIVGEDKTFETLFNEIKAGKFDCINIDDDLRRARLLKTLVGPDKDNLMTTSSTQSVMAICEGFGKYIKFVVEIEETAGTSTQLPALNAFAIMTAAQKQMQVGDSRLPFLYQ